MILLQSMKLLTNLPANWQVWMSIQEEISVLGIQQIGIVFDENQPKNLLEIFDPEIISGNSPNETVTIWFRDESIHHYKDVDFLYVGEENGIFREIKEEGKRFSFQILPVWVKYIYLHKALPIQNLV